MRIIGPIEGIRRLASRFRRAGTFARLSLTLLVLAPLWFAARTLWLHHVYWAQHARLAKNYSAELNAEAALVPEEQRAWPHYRDLLKKLDCRLPPEFFTQEGYLQYPDPERLRAIACLEKNRPLLPRLREVAAMPKLGYILKDASDPADLAWMKRLKMGSGQNRAAQENPDLLSVLVNYNHPLRHFAQLLRLDAELAAGRGDENTIAEDLIACLDIARQFKSQPMVLDDATSWSVLTSAAQLLEWFLTQNARSIAENHLHVMSDRLAAYREQGGFQLRLRRERLTFDDLVQRLYSDDGHGDGIFLAHRMEKFLLGDSDAEASWKAKFLAPFASGRCATRRQVVDRYNETFEEAARACALPLWECTRLPAEDARQMDEDERARYMLIYLFLPSISNIYLASNRAEQECDAAIATIALARFHLADGRWPERLEEMVPAYLRSIPPDCFTGKPLMYRVADGRPLLYSVGADRDDDGGKSPASNDEDAVAKWQPPGAPAVDGDWVFLPRRQPPALEKSGFYGTP